MSHFKSKWIQPTAIIRKEKKLIEKHYDFIRCEIKRDKLICYGEFCPTMNSVNYQYRIEYKPPLKPSVFVRSPKIEYNDDIHMYPEDNSLCLYHKTDLLWTERSHLFDTIIPWTHEWFVFYELYQFSGKWLHPEVKHRSTREKTAA